jgi:hypothetical protein
MDDDAAAPLFRIELAPLLAAGAVTAAELKLGSKLIGFSVPSLCWWC